MVVNWGVCFLYGIEMAMPFLSTCAEWEKQSNDSYGEESDLSLSISPKKMEK